MAEAKVEGAAGVGAAVARNLISEEASRSAVKVLVWVAAEAAAAAGAGAATTVVRKTAAAHRRTIRAAAATRAIIRLTMGAVGPLLQAPIPARAAKAPVGAT
jgi:hypothetical protein